MKVIACFVLVAFVALAQADDSPAEKAKKAQAAVHKACFDLHKADPALVEKAKKGEFAEDEKLKQHIFCYSQKVGFQDATGKVLYDNVHKGLKDDPDYKDPAELDRVIKKCAVQQEDGAKTVYDALKCYWEDKHKTIL